MPILRRIAHGIVHHAPLILLLGAALTLVTAWQLPDLELDPSAQSIMLEGDPARDFYERAKLLFGSDSIIAVAIHRPDTVFRPETLGKIQRMAAALGQLPHVERVESLATTDNFADCDAGLQPGPLYTDVPRTPEALAEVRRRAFANHTFVGNLVSGDARTAGLLVFVSARHVDRNALAAAIDALRAGDGPAPPTLVDDALTSPTFATVAWRQLPPPVRGSFGSLDASREPDAIPDVIARIVGRLLRDSGRLRRTVLREAPRASRRRLADLVDGAAAILREHDTDPDEDIYQVGTPVMKVRGARLQRQDLTRLLPCAVAVVAVVLLLAFRNVSGVLIPLGTVVVSVVWTFGLMTALGVPLTVITLIIGPLLIAVGNGYAMHLVAHFAQRAEMGESRRQRVEHALESCFLPVLLAGVTTIVGFLSVTLSRLSSVREFGLFSAFGILSALVISLTLAPAVLRYLPARRPRRPAEGEARSRPADVFDRLLRAIGRLDVHHETAIARVGLLLVLVALLGCLFVRVNTTYERFFHHGDQLRVNARRMHEQLAGAVPLSFVLDARQRALNGADQPGDEWRGPFTDPELLAFVLGLQDYIAGLRVGDAPDAPLAFDKATSFADQVQLMHQSFTGDREHRLPPTRAGVEELLDFFYKRQAGERFIDGDFARAHLYVRTYLTSSQAMGRLVEEIEAYAAERAPEGVQVTATGENVLILRAADEIAHGQIRSLVIAFVAIFTLMGILFTSARAGLLSILPNAVPVVGTFGLMGWLGVDLNIGTALVGSVALGIAVDDTIHYMTGFYLEMRRLGDQTRAMLATLHLRGRAMVFTSVALFFGFLVLVASRFAPISSFGYLTAAAMATALLGDLIVLPVLLRRVELVSLWDLLAARLPSDPEQWTGVLRGLTRREARAVVLLCRRRRVAQGAAIAVRGADRAGDARPVWAAAPEGPTLYAVLEGRVELRASPDGQALATLGPGEAFGEVSPELGRPPDAVAAEPTDLLLLDEESLKSLARRSPRAAAKVLRNLAALLAGRLFDATARLAAAPQDEMPIPPSPTSAPWTRLAPADQDTIRLLADARVVTPDEHIVLQPPADAPELWIVVSGELLLSAEGEEGQQTALAVAKGAVLSGSSTEAGTPCMALRAPAEAEALVVTWDALDRVVDRQPRVAARCGLALLRLLSRALDQALERLSASKLPKGAAQT